MDLAKKIGTYILLLPALLLADSSHLLAAKAINLRHQPVPILLNNMIMKETSCVVDKKQDLHIRMQQTYSGYEVMGADFVKHIHYSQKNQASSMNGIIYEDLHGDLANASSAIFTEAQSQKALQQVIILFKEEWGQSVINGKECKLKIFVDENNKAHWVYHISLRSEADIKNNMPVQQVYIMDAATFDVYEKWNDIQTAEAVNGGGFGGNVKTGKLIYDGLKAHLNSLMVTRDNNICYLKNQFITVFNYQSKNIMSYPCSATDINYNNVYWNSTFDMVNQGYSPGNDAFFATQMIKQMYEQWYGTAVLVHKNGDAKMLNLYVHKSLMEDAYWDPYAEAMVFGDGKTRFYPLTSLDIAAHEISHGFTSEHSKLIYRGQSGAMNEAFSDMAAQAAEAYAYGIDKNSWQIAASVTKANRALRYLDKPSKDCGVTGKPGVRCSIDDADQYSAKMDVHYASGIYNHFFYILANSPDWNVRKAFEVMVHTNLHYWTAFSTFNEGACNVISAAKQLGYDESAVKKAFDKVKVNYRQSC